MIISLNLNKKETDFILTALDLLKKNAGTANAEAKENGIYWLEEAADQVVKNCIDLTKRIKEAIALES